MFFDVGFSELLLLAIAGLLILGPERLPAVARTLGGWVRRGRQMAADFQRELEREVDLKDIKNLKNEVDEAAQPLRDAARALDDSRSILDPKKQLSKLVSDTDESPDIPDTIEPHEPIPSTESSDYESYDEVAGSLKSTGTKAAQTGE